MSTMTDVAPETVAAATVEAEVAEAVAAAVAREREEEQRRLRHRLKTDLRQMARERHLHVTGTKEELVRRLLDARWPRPPLPEPRPPFEMPPEGATREELLAALRAEAEDHRYRLQLLRDFAVDAHLHGAGGSRPCSGGTDQFMRAFSLPPYYVDGHKTAPQAEVPLDLDNLIDAHYTDAGLRHLLETRHAAHVARLAEIKAYGISHRSWFSRERLQEIFHAAGLGEYEVPMTAQVRFNWNWRVQPGVNRTREDRRIREALRATVRQLAGEGTDITELATEVYIREG